MIRKPLLLALLGLGSTLFAQEEPEPERSWSPAERSIVDTLRLLRRKERPTNEELVPRLAQWSAGNLPLLFEILEGREVPTHDANPAQTLSIYQEELVLLSLAELDRSKVRRFLKKRAVELDMNGRRATIGFLGAAGNANDFAELFGIALVGKELDLPQELAPAVRRAVAAILAAHEDGFNELLAANGELPMGFIREITLAIGDVGDPRGLVFLDDALDWYEDLTVDVLAQIRKLGLGSDETVNDSLRAKVRDHLREDRPMACRTAAVAAAALDDLEALPLLIELLQAESQGLRTNAHWALQTITRMTLSPFRDNWSRWYDDEKTWVQKRKLLAFSKLTSQDAGEVAAAIAEVSRHALVREDFGEALCSLLDRRFPQIRILALQQLADLRFESSRPYLDEACHDPVDEVAEAAQLALGRLNG